MQVNDRVTVKTDGGPRRSGVVLAIESFSEGTMYHLLYIFSQCRTKPRNSQRRGT